MLEEQIKYIILSFTPFSRCSRDSGGGKKRDEERRAYWKVFVAADGALASNCIYRLREEEIASRVVFSKLDAIVTSGNQKRIRIPNAVMKCGQVIKTTRQRRGLWEKGLCYVCFIWWGRHKHIHRWTDWVFSIRANFWHQSMGGLFEKRIWNNNMRGNRYNL